MAESRIEFWPTPAPQAPIAFLTMARDESVLMKAWVLNGLRISREAEFFVLDHASNPPLSDEMADFIAEHRAKISFVALPAIPFDDDFKAMALTGFAKMLTQCYQVVVTTDCDELLVGLGIRDSDVLPKLLSLDGVIAPIGFEVVQHVSREEPFDPTRPIESQRAYGFLASGYTKPVVWRKRTEFGGGLHKVRDGFEYEPTLGLLHLRSVDAGLSSIRAGQRRGTRVSTDQMKAGRGGHWNTDPQKKIDFFAKLNALRSIPEYNDVAPDFIDAMKESYGRSSAGFYGHNISQVSAYCHVGGLIYS